MLTHTGYNDVDNSKVGKFIKKWISEGQYPDAYDFVRCWWDEAI